MEIKKKYEGKMNKNTTFENSSYYKRRSIKYSSTLQGLCPWFHLAL